ncbi:uncharacterized protein LOC106140999 isoform X2 [Amyelois transitella]|uniref:uncharacterized protein LOC106140999 isoform X2 n=1 Tax=Amyelois transitella TaxID=680683 RepID=UPI00298FFC8B|nr:uncharacterized protein LOC106140999 isoform X2 [Amyelois transitella]
MSQPKRRSRKAKLVPRSTEGGEPEIQVTEMEEPQIKIMNTRSLATPQQSPKKSSSIQFKVDIEVEEWINDELFIEENFAKMQTEKLSEALEKEIKEEDDWTNDEYRKLWAEVASDSDNDEEPLNEYEKLIKNQIKPIVTAGPSKEKVTAKKEEPLKEKKDDIPSPTKPVPKPNLKIKTFERTYSKKNNRNNQPVINNMQPKLRINVVFTDEPVPKQDARSVGVSLVKSDPQENVTASVSSKTPLDVISDDKPGNNIKSSNINKNKPVKAETTNITVDKNDKNITLKSIKVEKNSDERNSEKNTAIQNKTFNRSIENIKDKFVIIDPAAMKPVYVIPKKISHCKRPIYILPDDCKNKSCGNPKPKCDTNKSISPKNSNVVNNPHVKDEKSDTIINIGDSSDEDKNYEPVLIEVNKSAEKINKDELRDIALRSILKKQLKDMGKSMNKPVLEQIKVGEDIILYAAEELAKGNDPLLKALNIELRNRIGGTRFEYTEMTRESALIDYALRQWFNWQGTTTTRSVPLLYKCYICNEGWWHLDPFRNHIKCHNYVSVTLEKHNQECNIIAHDQTKRVTFKMFPIDGACWKCGKGYGSHKGLQQSYKCSACKSTLYTCQALVEHEGICLSKWKEQMKIQKTKDVKAFKCKICPQIFFTQDKLNRHQYMFHVPRSDYPMLVMTRQCMFCNQNYLVYSYHYCRGKVQKYFCKICMRHFPSENGFEMHLSIAKKNVQCKFCMEIVGSECSMMDHLLKHTDKFKLMYKCLMCHSNVMLENELMLKRHAVHVHRAAKLMWCCSKVIIPTSCYEGNKEILEYKPLPKRGPKSKSNPLLEKLIMGDKQNLGAVSLKNSTRDTSNIEDVSQDSTDIEELNSSIREDVIEDDCDVSNNKNVSQNSMDIEEREISSVPEDETQDTILKVSNQDLCTLNEGNKNCIVKKEPRDSLEDDIENPMQDTNNVMPTIKIENVMANYCEENSSNLGEIDTKADTPDTGNFNEMDVDVKPTLLELQSIKIEPHDEAGTEVNASDLLEFDEIVVKQEKVDDFDMAEAGSSKMITKTYSDANNLTFLDRRRKSGCKYDDDTLTNVDTPKKFTEQLQNFLETMEDDIVTTTFSGKIIKDEMIVCQTCGFEGRRRQYKNHLKVCKSSKLQKLNDKRSCTKCKKTFPTMRLFIKHLTKHGFKYLQCNECEMTFANLSLWTVHMSSHITRMFVRVKLLSNETRVFRCKVCKEMLQRNMFFKHWETHIHQQDLKVVQCKSESGIPKELLEQIVDIFDTVRKKVPKDCIVCGRFFSRMTDKKRHLVEHLLESALAEMNNTYGLVCQICRSVFQKSDHFRRHMRDHAGLTVYHCEFCDKTFSDSSNFVKHKKTHNVGAFICDLCKKKFLAKSSLIAHLEKHNYEPFPCMWCPDKKFYSHSAYKKHVRGAHERSQGFSCFVCRSRFPSVRAKWDHQWERHGIRYKIADCPICDKKFRKSTDLKKHMSNEHEVKS